MVYPNRPDWPHLGGGTVVWPILVIAGVPFVFVTPGCPLTTVRWDGSAADSAFWPAPTIGTTSGIPTRTWLRISQGLRFGFRVHPPDGTVDVNPPDIALYDDGTADSPTALFASSEAAPTSALNATLSASGTSLTVGSTGPFGSSGTGVAMWIGGEALTGTVGSDGHTIASLVRGLYGTSPSIHIAQAGNTISRVYGALPSLNGRRACVFLAMRDPADATGVTALNPEMRFDGVISGGGAKGTLWALKLNPWVRKPEDRTDTPLGSYTISGIVHVLDPSNRGASIRYPSDIGPLAANWNSVNMALTTGDPATAFVGDGTLDDGGWSPDAQTFINRWQHAAAALTIPDSGVLSALLNPDGTVSVRASSTSSVSALLVTSEIWGTFWNPDESSTTEHASYRTPGPFPDTLQPFDRMVYLQAADAAQIPATPAPLSIAHPYNPTINTQVSWTLSVTINGTVRTSRIDSITTPTSSRCAIVLLTAMGGGARTGAGTDWLIQEACVATLGAWVQTGAWWEGLQALAIALNSLPGSGVVADAYDWDDIAAQAISGSASASPFDVTRNGPIDLSKPFIDLFTNEVRLAGGAVVVRRGRISWRRFTNLSGVSPTAATLSKGSARPGMDPTVEDARDRIVASYSATAVDGSVYTVNDQDAAAQSGGSFTAWKADIPAGSAPPVVTSAWVQGFTAFGLTAIAPWRTSYRLMTFYGTLELLAVTAGDNVAIPDDWMVPSGLGRRGFIGVGQVLAAEERLFASDSGVDLTIKLTTTAFATPYAPECLIASGGIDTTTGVLTIDSSTFGGLSGLDGFGQPGSAHGGAENFHVGDRVRLIQVGVATPDTPFDCIVQAVDISTSTSRITVTPAPSSTWAGYTSLGPPTFVMLTFQDYASATNGVQRDYAFVGDSAAGVIVTGVLPDRWQ